MAKVKSRKEKIEHSTNYIQFLEKRLASANYKANSSAEEYKQTQEKLKKEKLILKILM